MDSKYLNTMNIPSELLDEIQHNIEEIISNFDVPTDNKMDVIRKINFIYSQSKYLSITDELTGLYNRRHFESNFEREFLRAKRYNSNLSVAIVDIDFFKQINDKYGHLTGDFVLREIAFILKDSLRKTDMVFRYGGEEFAILLTETDSEQSLIPLERLRKYIETKTFVKSGNSIKFTVSIGVSSNIIETNTPDELLELADKALYKAKNSGRNQVVVN